MQMRVLVIRASCLWYFKVKYFIYLMSNVVCLSSMLVGDTFCLLVSVFAECSHSMLHCTCNECRDSSDDD